MAHPAYGGVGTYSNAEGVRFGLRCETEAIVVFCGTGC